MTVTRSAESASTGNLGSDMIERGLIYGLQDEQIPGAKIKALNAHEVCDPLASQLSFVSRSASPTNAIPSSSSFYQEPPLRLRALAHLL